MSDRNIQKMSRPGKGKAVKVNRNNKPQLNKKEKNNLAAMQELYSSQLREIVRIKPQSDSAMKQATETVRELVDAILTQRRPYVIPRYAGAYVAPHQYRWKLPLPLTSPEKFRTALIVSNNLDNILSIGQAEDGDVSINFGSFTNVPQQSANYPQGEICLDYTLSLANGKSYKSSTSLAAGFSHWSASRSSFVGGFKYYPGRFASPTADPIVLSFNNPSKMAGNITYHAGTVLNGVPTPVINHTEVLVNGVNSYDLSTDASFAAFQTAAESVNSSGFYFTIELESTSGNYQESNGNYIGLELGPISLATPLSWKAYSLWELMAEGEIARAQYMRAARHNVTGNIMTLTNTTAMIVKGGSLYAARLPGNTYADLGSTTQDIINVIACQVDHVLESADLASGMHYSFTPEKVQDWLFERSKTNDPYEGNPENIPYCAIVLDATGVGESATPTFNLTGICSVEYLTTDPSNWKVSSPSQSAIFEAVLNSLAAENCVSCNPDHFAHLKRVVDKVMTSDNIKYALRTIVSAGVKVAPFVLSML